MVSSDTVVGIVGAVVLVAVMVGVFVYEYNNAPDENGDFAAAFPNLSASEDIDGDGIANGADDDVDGDGVANADDEAVEVAVAFTGQIAMQTATATNYTTNFTVGSGNHHTLINVTYASTTPSPLPRAPSLAAALEDETGETVANAVATQEGTTVTLTFDITEPLPAGTYTLVVTHSTPGAGADLEGLAVIAYE